MTSETSTPSVAPKQGRLAARIRSHMPIFIAVGLAVAVFAGLHGAATIVAVGIGSHIVMGLVMFGIRRWYKSRSKKQGLQP